MQIWFLPVPPKILRGVHIFYLTTVYFNKKRIGNKLLDIQFRIVRILFKLVANFIFNEIKG